MDWEKCIICQLNTKAALSCPWDHTSHDPIPVYNNFLSNVAEFKELDALPVRIEIPCEVTTEILMRNKACWHRSCHQKFNNSKLERQKSKKRRLRESEEETRRSKWQSTKQNMNLCIFCESENPSYKLHAYSTFSAERSLREMTEEMQDTAMMAKISGVDLVAIEAKYHAVCLTKYRNRYRSYQRQKNGMPNEDSKKAKARAFAELVMNLRNSLEEGNYIFKLSEVRHLYESRLEQLGENISVNKTRFKEKIMDAFADLGITEQFDGKNINLVFPDDMQEMLKDAEIHRNYDEEALILMKAAKICRVEMFQLGSRLSGSFAPNCQELSVSPSLKLLTSMIMYGSNIKESVAFSQPCLTASQLITHNSKKRVKTSKCSTSNNVSKPIK